MHCENRTRMTRQTSEYDDRMFMLSLKLTHMTSEIHHDLSLLPQDVSKNLEERRRQIAEVFAQRIQRKRMIVIMKQKR